MKMITLLAVAAWLAVLGVPARADFADGLAAFDAGDYRTALAEWRALADQGDTEAQIAIAGMYLAGHGVPPDASQAAHWYARAAERGDAVAQLNLGDFYARGLGVPRDLVNAYFWLSLAVEQGKRWPDLRRREIAARMAPGERAEAEARLTEWRRTH